MLSKDADMIEVKDVLPDFTETSDADGQSEESKRGRSLTRMFAWWRARCRPTPTVEDFALRCASGMSGIEPSLEIRCPSVERKRPVGTIYTKD